MAIKSSELQWWFAGVDGKLGRRAQSGVLHDMFPLMTGANNRDSIADYHRPIIIFNASAQTLTAARVFFKTLDSGGAIFRLALDPLGVQSGANRIISLYEDRPTTYTSGPVSFATGLALPASLGPSQGIGIWIQRQGNNFAAGRSPEKNTLTIQGTTPA